MTIKVFSFLFSVLIAEVGFAQEQKLYLSPKSAISTSVGQLFKEVQIQNS